MLDRPSIWWAWSMDWVLYRGEEGGDGRRRARTVLQKIHQQVLIKIDRGKTGITDCAPFRPGA